MNKYSMRIVMGNSFYDELDKMDKLADVPGPGFVQRTLAGIGGAFHGGTGALREAGSAALAPGTAGAGKGGWDLLKAVPGKVGDAFTAARTGPNLNPLHTAIGGTVLGAGGLYGAHRFLHGPGLGQHGY